MRDPHVIVIGGGYSGAMTAAHLAGRGVATVVIEPGVLGRGVAYAATPYRLLLNTPASAMSALPDAPRHFEVWLERRASRGVHDRAGQAPIEPPVQRTDEFAPRAVYGDYLEQTIAELARGRLDTLHARAIAVARTAEGFVVRCDDGSELAAPSIVLALGNPPPRVPSALASTAPGNGDRQPTSEPSPGYAAEPYQAIRAIADDDPVAILGTGLTALDVVAALRNRGHRGPIVCASRRGLLPIAHGQRPDHSVSVPRELVRQPSLRALLDWWRLRIERAHPASGRHEHEVALIAALRPFLSTIWRRLPIADRARFLRHVRPRWDVLRHRAPPSVRAVIDLGIAERSIDVIAARLDAVDVSRASLRCRFVAADGTTHTRDVRWLINCTGPERDVRRLRSPLVQSLAHHRLLAPDPLGLGVLTGPGGQLIGEDGPVPGAFAVGPWRMADLWEASAVPELRHHAADTATAIAGAPAPDDALLQAAG
jgi:uncharacterized NAD(P)/FAD-binding protein YdhS